MRTGSNPKIFKKISKTTPKGQRKSSALNALWYFETGTIIEKDIHGKTGKIRIKSGVYLIVRYQY
jgi:hypothetical protein